MNSEENVRKTFWGSIIGGVLGAMGGAERSSHIFRGICIPLFIAGEAYHYLQRWECILVLLMIAVFTIGYGIPDVVNVNGDEGSPLGRFWCRIFNVIRGQTKQSDLRYKLTNIFTRGTIGILASCTLSVISVVKENYLLWLIGSVCIVSVYSFLSWKGLGNFMFQGRRLIFSEFVTYATITVVGLALIYF